MPVKSFTIDRSRWLRGDINTSTLRNDNNCRCCLGFYLGACGVDDEHLTDVPFPADASLLAGGLPKEASWLVTNQGRDTLTDASTVDSRLCKAITDANDYATNSPSAREAEIARLFAEQGIEVTFVDGDEQ